MSSPYWVSAYISPACSIRPGVACQSSSASRPFDTTFGMERTTKLVPRKLLSWKSL